MFSGVSTGVWGWKMQSTCERPSCQKASLCIAKLIWLLSSSDSELYLIHLLQNRRVLRVARSIAEDNAVKDPRADIPTLEGLVVYWCVLRKHKGSGTVSLLACYVKQLEH